jgi:hypothetical protein
MEQEFPAKIIKVFPPVYPEMLPRMDIAEIAGKEIII